MLRDRSRFQAPGDVLGKSPITSPYRSIQSKRTRIRLTNRIVTVANGIKRNDRPKRFLSESSGGRRHIRQNGWLEESRSQIAPLSSSHNNLATQPSGFCNVRLNFVGMAGSDQTPHIEVPRL